MFLSLLVSILLTTFSGNQGESTVYLESWKKGTGQIQEQKLMIELSSTKPESQKVIRDAKGTDRYRLVIHHQPFAKYEKGFPEVWFVSLFDEPLESGRKAKRPEANLLDFRRPSEGRHTFYTEDSISRFMPHEDPIQIKLKVYYPFLSKRVIKVEGFYCILRVIGYKVSSVTPNVLESLTIEAEFKNDLEKN
jgi:hypothetical protein